MQTTNEFSFILKPSPIGGVGVFALHDIPADADLALVPSDYETRLLHESEIPLALRMYCVARENDMWVCPAQFNRLELSWHLNHSEEPNALHIGKGAFRTCKAIKADEEILINYNTLNEPEAKKEDYYRQQ